jgi:hypothetical protein
MSATVVEHVKSKGVKFASSADAAGAILMIASTPSVNGMPYISLSRYKLTLSNIGRCFTIIPRDEDAPFGYMDQNVDDYPNGSKADWGQNVLLSASQRVNVKPQDQ